MANQPVNQSDHIDGLHAFIEKGSDDLPDWINQGRESAFNNYKNIFTEQLKTPTWRDTKLNSMIDVFFEKDFSNQQSTLDDFEPDSNLDDSIKIFFHSGLFFTNEEMPSYIKFLQDSHSKERSSLFSEDNYSERQSIPYLLNNIISRDALLIETAENQHVERLIHVIHMPHQNANIAPRLMIHLSKNSSIKVIEEHLQSSDSIINNLIDIKCEESSSLQYYKISHAQNDSHQINNLNLEQMADTAVNVFNVDLGADSASSLNHLKLNGENSDVSCSTLFMPSADRSSHHNVVVDHLSNKSSSSVNYRGVIDDHAAGSFFGKVRVEKEREQTSAFMQNKNLLLSDNSRISTVPVLEIYNDDTECSHSATSGSLDKEKLFYLKTRGINEFDAKDFLIKSFMDELITQIKSRRLREYINALILGYREH
ncbi:MAG TPA: Fe-S cluster assembly protein SufD [Gammaproteobacteria bacterium]|nr:Fe-S cluster assembly protein SufD [Gammaproteobacteria bacterium]